jgi:hypothetical protein
VYLGRTSGSYAQQLGLERYVLTQGLARKIMPQPLVASRDTMLIQGEGFLDVARTRALWSDVFRAPRSVIARGTGWTSRRPASPPPT